MKKALRVIMDVCLLGIAMVLWLGSFWIREFSFRLVYWVHENIFQGGGSPETGAAMLVALFYVVVTYVGVVMLVTFMTRMVHGKRAGECLTCQTYRFFAFWGFLPLVIAAVSWKIVWPFLPAELTFPNLPLPYFETLVSLSDILCEWVLIFSVGSVIFSVIFFGCGFLINSNIYLNRIFAVLWLIYGYYAAFVFVLQFEYGKWFLLFVAAAYLVGTSLFLLGRKNKTKPLMPRYEVVILSLDEFETYDKITVDEEKEYDVSIFMPTGDGKDGSETAIPEGQN